MRKGRFLGPLFRATRDYADEDDYFRVIENLTTIPAEVAKTKINHLAQFGLIDINNEDFLKYRDYLSPDTFKINDSFVDILLAHGNEATLLDSLIGERATSTLSLEDYEYMKDHARHLIEVVRSAAESDEGKNKNYGVAGVPGVGKTEFMGVIQQETGVPVYFVGAGAKQSGSDPLLATFKEPKRSESFGDLLRASFIVKRLGLKAILVKDEAEGILAIATKDADKEDTSNKGFINYFLDNNETPIIYITNHLGALQSAAKRRLVSWTTFRQPPAKARLGILSKQFKQHKLPVTDQFVRQIAEEFPELSPAVTMKIIRDIASRRDIRNSFSSLDLQKLVQDQFQQQQLALNDGVNFSVFAKKPTAQASAILWNTDVDLGALSAQLGRIKHGSLLTLVGPLGTGKKAFAYDFVNQNDKSLIEKSISDIAFGDPRSFEEFSDLLEEAELNNSAVLLSGQNHLADKNTFILDHFLRLIESKKTPIILTIDAPAATKPPVKLIDSSFEMVNFNYLGPYQSMLAYYHFFERPAPEVIQTFKTLTPAMFSSLKTIMEQADVVFSDEEIIGKLHRRVDEYKMSGLVPLNMTLGYSENPKAEIAASIPVDYRNQGVQLVQRLGIPLSLAERYDMLKKLPEIIKWRDVAAYIPSLTVSHKPAYYRQSVNLPKFN